MNLLAWIKNPRLILSTAIAGVFSATTVIVFNLLGWSLLLAVLLLVTIALVAVIVYLVRQLRAAKAAEEIEKTISHQADRDIERSSPGLQAEMQSMKQELLTAIESLKKSKSGRRGQGALSVLPWYMVVGPREAGKGTMIRRSGLHFPLVDESQNPKSVRGVGGTRSLEWWLCDDAVLLDLAGRAVGAAAQFEDNDDWFAFLDVLRKQRKEKPLNGLIVAMPCDQLGAREEAKLDKIALGVRERIQELIERLGIVFPVYVVFTKVDHVAGFAEFFGDLDAAGRIQPWGATVAPERAREQDPGAVFDAEFEHLAAALSDRRLSRMPDVPDPLQRARAFAFPLQLERLRPGMRRFLRVLFQPDPQQETALFRGFYFASSVQEGAPVDRVLQPAAESLGVAAAESAAPPMAANGAYFVHDLLTRVVFKDQALAVVSTRAQAARKRGRILLFGGLGVALLGIAILLITLAMVNAALPRAAQVAGREAQSVTAQTDLRRSLDALEALRKPTEALDDLTRGKPVWRLLGAYAGDPVADPALQLYTEKLLEVVIVPGFQRMESELTRLTDSNQGTFYDYYVLFRAWRLLSVPSQITPEDAPILAGEIRRLRESELALGTPQERERFRALVQDQMAFIANHPRWLVKLKEHYYRVSDQTLAARAAERVRKTWDSSQFYARMVEQASPATKEATLATLIGQPGFLSANGKVAGPYTLAGWEQQIKPAIEQWRLLMQRDWVIKEAFQNNPPDLVRDLSASYARDYSKQWVDFMNSVSVQDVRDLRAVNELLKLAAQKDSPILRLLRAIGSETSLGVDDASDVGAVQRDFAILHNFFGPEGLAGTARRGLGILQKKPSRLDANAPMSDRYEDELKNVQKEVQKLADGNEPMSAMAKLAQPGSPASTAIGWVSGIGGGYAGPAAQATVRLLLSPIRGARAAAATTVAGDLSERWSQGVHQKFRQTLAGKYPFTDGGPDASKFDFDEFFRPGGTFWSFYDANLKDKLAEDGTPLGGEGGVPLSPALVDCVRRAYAIRQAFFALNPGVSSLKFSVRTKPPEIEGPNIPVRRISLDLGGATVTYLMGVSDFRELEWPGADPNAGAALRVETIGTPADALTQSGPWALFRLLDRAQLSRTESPTPAATWRLSAGPTQLRVTYEFQPATGYHPFKPRFLRFSVPSSVQ